ncbi:type II secretion system F family protein [bacterium]|nr:type II secretion system F family protein [bacterium]
MIDITLLISLLIFAGVMLLVIGIFSFLRYQRDRRDLMEKIKTDERSRSIGNAHASHGSAEDLKRVSDSILKRYITNFIAAFGDALKPKKAGELSHIQKVFLRAGYRGRMAINIYFGVKGFLTFLLPAAFFAFHISVSKWRLTNVQLMLILLLLATTGFYLPSIWIRLKIDRRKDKIFRGFPDVLDLLVVCVEAGVGLNEAICRVSEEMEMSHREISEEMQMLNLELRAGRPRKDALKNFASRINLEDVDSLVTLLIQTERFGTSVAKALRVYSDTMRSRRRERAEEMAAKMAVKLLFPLIFFIFPALFVTILGPAIIQVLKIWHR